jgi:hypothetical protein
MPSKTPLTPDAVDAQLAAAEAEHRRFSAKAAAIQQAGDETRVAVELAELRDAYAALPRQAREARDQAQAELDALTAADVLDINALLSAFDKVQRLDAECGGVAGHVAQLDRIDPLPRTAHGVERMRPPQCQRLHAGARFSDYLDALVTSRADAAGSKRTAELRDELAATIESAEQIARQQAAQLADGQRLHVDSPETIVAKYHDAITAISDEKVEAVHAEARVAAERAGGSVVTARQLLRQAELDRLLNAERGDDDNEVDDERDDDQDQADDELDKDELDGDDQDQDDA